MRILARLLLVSVVLFIGVQFIRPAATNPVAGAPLAIADPRVESILRRSCFDCHSNETRWPWYSHVAPVSWRVTDHVNHGRKHLNFSDWSAADSAERIEEICKETKEREMPLRDYLLLHRDARLSREDIEVLCGWSQVRAEQLAVAVPRQRDRKGETP